MEDKEKIVPEAEEVKAEEAAPAAEETKEEVKAEPKKEKSEKKKMGGGAIAAIVVGGVAVLAAIAFVVLAVVSGSAAVNAYKAKDYNAAYEKSGLAIFMSAGDKNAIAEKYVTEVLCKEGRYYEAAGVLEKTSLSAEKIAEICQKNSFLGLCVKGQVVTFGQYETDGDAANGPEDLEWIVLDVVKEGGIARAFIMTKDVVGTPGGWNASTTNTSTFYSDSTLYEWCNVDFYNDFTKHDVNIKAKILKTTVKTEDSSGGVDSGEDVQAYAFAPSTQEIEQYLTGDLAQYKIASATKAATKAGVTGFGKDAAAVYLVRNIGNFTDGGQWAAGYTKDGKFQEGLSMTGTTSGARVCMNVYLGES